MMVSTKGRYALRVLIDLAEHGNDAYIPMKDVAQRQLEALQARLGTTFVMVTHDPRQAEKTQRIVRLFDGRQVD